MVFFSLLLPHFSLSAVIKHIHQNYGGVDFSLPTPQEWMRLGDSRLESRDFALVTFCHAQFFTDDIFPSSLRDEKVVVDVSYDDHYGCCFYRVR